MLSSTKKEIIIIKLINKLCVWRITLLIGKIFDVDVDDVLIWFLCHRKKRKNTLELLLSGSSFIKPLIMYKYLKIKQNMCSFIYYLE